MQQAGMDEHGCDETPVLAGENGAFDFSAQEKHYINAEHEVREHLAEKYERSEDQQPQRRGEIG